MFNDAKEHTPQGTRTDAAPETAPREYRKPQVRVIARTSELLRGDYGANSDMYRNYQP